MNNTPVSSVDSEESALFDESTAPTTPDGSLTFSPVLQALRATDALEMDAIASLSALQPPSTAAQASHVVPVQVRNICCVGAGYVGAYPRLPTPQTSPQNRRLHLTRRPDSRRHRFEQPLHPRHGSRPRRGKDPALELPPPAHLRAPAPRGPARRQGRRATDLLF